MKATPKLQETLDVFLDELTKLDSSLKNIKSISPELDSKIMDLKSIKIEVDYEPLSRKHQELEFFFNDFKTDLIRVFSDNKTKIQDDLKKQNKEISRFYYAVLIMFMITCTSVYLVVKLSYDKNKIEQEFIISKSNQSDMEQYIRDSKQVGKFNKWMENQKKSD